jgi:hypothetical protein
MKIYTVNSPLFEHNGVTYGVEAHMYASFLEFDNYLKEKKPNYVYIYNITNVDMNDNLIHPCNGWNSIDETINIIFIRFKMFK